MTFNLTDDQCKAVQRGEPVHVCADAIGEVMIVPISAYEAMVDEREKAAWAKLNRVARERWGRENPY
jgi:hypothetical protein